ncbi:MAG: glucose-6-phosphate isomerase [Clostridiaceae bacterium]|jgi:glucose-6-phosphate isomerase|nr:glucose-6-phosphate isomerase [Bacillota bacterium]NLN51526.1 glucose-6-phosphate isomerase [Clostridiaceae bacterium]
MIRICENHLRPFVKEHELEQLATQLAVAFDNLVEKKGPGNDFLGWVDLPVDYDQEEFERIKIAANKIREQSDVLLVIGIGGSYLGARAVIDALSPSFPNNGQELEVIFAGHQMSGDYLIDLMKYIEDKDVSLNVISKSGTTTEPAIAFRILREFMDQKYGVDAQDRIFITTDKARGALKELANQVGYETFVVPDDVGGRYSVLTAVGLLPIAAAGISIDELMQGAVKQREKALNFNLEENDILRYAGWRNVLLRRNYPIEILVNYEPSLMFFNEWWKQLYGESEGKDGKGLFPAGVNFSSDLHSMGQFIQDGARNMFETVLDFKHTRNEISIPQDEQNLDELNYISGKTLQEVNRTALEGVMLAHEDGGTPTIRLEIEKLDTKHIGALIYFFEFACGISGHVLGVNPFDQPGVEDYKRNMFALLGKPGYEEVTKKLQERLNG